MCRNTAARKIFSAPPLHHQTLSMSSLGLGNPIILVVLPEQMELQVTVYTELLKVNKNSQIGLPPQQ